MTDTNGMTLTGPVDDIRMLPADAMINTYAYEPLKGISRRWDANNKVFYYGYDVANWLLIIRDQDKKIIKKSAITMLVNQKIVINKS